MSAAETDEKSAVLDRIVESLTGSIASAKAGKLASFARNYIRRIPVHELREHPSEHWRGLISGHFEFARKRIRGKTLLRVFNPVEGTDGWTSNHTVVEHPNPIPSSRLPPSPRCPQSSHCPPRRYS